MHYPLTTLLTFCFRDRCLRRGYPSPRRELSSPYKSAKRLHQCRQPKDCAHCAHVDGDTGWGRSAFKILAYDVHPWG